MFFAMFDMENIYESGSFIGIYVVLLTSGHLNPFVSFEFSFFVQS